MLHGIQASTQFQGEGSSHELASLLLTECVQYSLNVLKKPMYALYLDAKSAFDVVQRELLVKSLFQVQGADKSLLCIDKRLAGQKTVVEWARHLMGPIDDERGLEQGGISSSDFYKIFGKEQLSLPQNSCLGVPLPAVTVSAIGQADDTVLISNDIFNLFYLLQLSKSFSGRNLVEQGAEKTKLQKFTPRRWTEKDDVGLNPIKINGKQIPFSETAEHVGLVRSTDGNGPAIAARFSAHRRALAGVLHAGLSYRHRSNPSFNIKIEKMYATPVLLSGLASLVLTGKETDLINKHYTDTLSRLLKLHDRTPRSVVHFLAGSLPASALLHIRQLGLFAMLCRLPCENALRKYANEMFESGPLSKKAWFAQIQALCVMYSLPQPLVLLTSPPEKDAFKLSIKKKVLAYWESLLRDEAKALKSLCYFKPHFMSLLKPHPLFTSAGTSPYRVTKACIQARMMSGRYRCGALFRHWKPLNSGYCLLSESCKVIEDVPHILQWCDGLRNVREKLFDHTQKVVISLPDYLREVIYFYCNLSSPSFCDFLLDCSSLPLVISTAQKYGEEILLPLFSLSQTWVFMLHRERLKLLGRWKAVGYCENI